MRHMSTQRKMQDLFMDMGWLINTIEVSGLRLVGELLYRKKLNTKKIVGGLENI